MAAKTTEFQTDTTVLGRYWMLNDSDAALESAVKEIELELLARNTRREVTKLAAQRSAERAAEVRELIDSVTTSPVYDVETEGL